MISTDVLLTYTLACFLLVIAPGPDNILAVSRGLGQGKLAACISGLSSGVGILFHVLAATLGLTLLIQTSPIAFLIVKLTGATYLIWLGIAVLRSRTLINLVPSQAKSLNNIFSTGFFSAALNPKPGMFVVAFIPQFVDPSVGPVNSQMIYLGVWFALLTAIGFSLMGVFASNLTRYIQNKPRFVNSLNIGAASTFILSGMAIALIE